MTRSILRGCPWSLVVAVLLAASANAQPAPQPKHAATRAKPASKEPVLAIDLTLEPKAIDILQAASARLAAARTMRFTAVIDYESPSLLGPPLIYTTKSDVALQRPDKLRVITPGDGPPSEFYYDGKVMMAFAPTENLVAVADAPPTIDAMLKAAYDSAAIYFPFSDVIVADPYKDIAEGLKVAFYIGQSTRGRRHDDGHDRLRRRRGFRADVDRRRGPSAAHAACDLSQRSLAAAPPDGVLQLAARPRAAAGRVRILEGCCRDADRIRPSRPAAPARAAAPAQAQVAGEGHGGQDAMRSRVMKQIAIGCAAFLIAAVAGRPAAAWSHANRYGGAASGGGGSWIAQRRLRRQRVGRRRLVERPERARRHGLGWRGLVERTRCLRRFGLGRRGLLERTRRLRRFGVRR